MLFGLSLFFKSWVLPRSTKKLEQLKRKSQAHILGFHVIGAWSSCAMDWTALISRYQRNSPKENLKVDLVFVTGDTPSGSNVVAYRCFQCSRCLRLFKDGLTLWSHVSFECRMRSPDVYNCEFCVYKSKWKSNLKRHKIMVHKHLMEPLTYDSTSTTSYNNTSTTSFNNTSTTS